MVAMTLPAPKANKVEHIRSVHGIEFLDNYEWLRDKEAAATIDLLKAENAYTEQETKHLDTLKENIYQEIKSRVKETEMSVPTRKGQYWYYSRTEEGKSYAYSCRVPVKPGQDAWKAPEISVDNPPADEQIMLDINQLAEGHEFISLGAASVSPNGELLTYSVDTAGDERFDLRIKNLTTGEHLSDEIQGVFYGAQWVGNEYVFYQRVDEAWRPHSIWRHKVGTNASEDVEIFNEADERFSVGMGLTRSKKYLIIQTSSRLSTEIWVIDANKPESKPRLLHRRKPDLEISADHAVVGGQDIWMVLHNQEGPNFSLGWVGVEEHERAGNEDLLTKLQELIAHRDTVRLEDVDIYRDQMVLAYREGATPRAAVMDLRGVESLLTASTHTVANFEEITFDEELYSVSAGGNPEWEAPVIRVGYTSFTTPSRVFDYWIETKELQLLKEQEVLGEFNREDYVANRMWVTARDGARIPVSLVRRKALDMSKPNPMLLYGYGSYEYSLDPGFSISRLSMLDRGLIFAIAHVRGGGEMGRGWYDTGKIKHKKNTFTDFIDVADALIEQEITAPSMLVAEGGSAGGLLMGAVANMGGDRFTAIQASVPFVDPLTSMLMPELPLTVGEWEEWGDPLHDREIYEYMASYAPYENIEAKPYPDILAITSLNDTRVLYVEPAKWIAKLRELATGGKFLLQTEMVAGHAGVSGRYEQWRKTAFELSWSIHAASGITQ